MENMGGAAREAPSYKWPQEGGPRDGHRWEEEKRGLPKLGVESTT